MQEPPLTAGAPPGRVASWLPFSAAIASTLVLVLPVLLHPEVQLFYRDTGRLYYPLKKFIAERLRAGHLPLWDPWTEAGVSLLGQVSPGIFHPLNLLYLALPFDFAFKLNHLLALPLAASGTYWFARKLGASPWASAAAGIIFGGAGYLVSTVASNLPYALGPASIPAACAALLWVCERPSPMRLLGASTLLALCNYSGEPQSALFAGVIGAACALGLSQSDLEPGASRRDRLRRLGRALGWTALWGAAALALAMPAVLPGGLRAHASKRWSGLSDEERTLFSVHPFRLAALAIPLAFDDTDLLDGRMGQTTPYDEYLSIADRSSFADSICLGAPAMLLVLFAFLTDRRGRWLALGGLVLALGATGEALGMQAFLFRLVPGLGLFRYAEKMLGPASLLFALAAARGLDASLAGSKRAALGLLGICAVAGTSSLAMRLWLLEHGRAAFEFLVTHGHRHRPGAALAMIQMLEQGLWLAGSLAIALGLIALLRTASARKAAVSLALGGACCFAAVMSYASNLLFVGPVAILSTPSPLADELLRRAGPSEHRWRVHVDDRGLPKTEPRFAIDPRTKGMEITIDMLASQTEGLSRIEGMAPYFSLLDDTYNQFLISALINSDKLFGARFLYTTATESKSLAAKIGFESFRGGWLVENPLRPRAFLVSRVFVPPLEDLLPVMADPLFDPTDAAVLSRDDRALIGAVPHGPPGSATYSRLAPEQIDVAISAPARRLLVIGEHFDPGWSATIDGAPATIVRADGIALGVSVDAGEHRIQLRFWPRGLTAGLLSAVGAFAAFAAAIFLAHQRATRGQVPALH